MYDQMPHYLDKHGLFSNHTVASEKVTMLSWPSRCLLTTFAMRSIVVKRLLKFWHSCKPPVADEKLTGPQLSLSPDESVERRAPLRYFKKH